MTKNSIIITAGGGGERMKNKINKIFLVLGEKPIIFHTLKTLEKMSLIDEILITIKKENLVQLKKIINQAGFKKIKKIISSKKNRQESTWKTLQYLKQKRKSENDLIGIHNAVNPLVTKNEIKAVFQTAAEWGAALLATPAKDTIKICQENLLVKKTPLKKLIWHAQTPQVARFGLFFKAFKKAAQEKNWGTDDTMLIERLGKKIKVIPCSEQNFKITYPKDLILAEEILRQRQR